MRSFSSRSDETEPRRRDSNENQPFHLNACQSGNSRRATTREYCLAISSSNNKEGAARDITNLVNPVSDENQVRHKISNQRSPSSTVSSSASLIWKAKALQQILILLVGLISFQRSSQCFADTQGEQSRSPALARVAAAAAVGTNVYSKRPKSSSSSILSEVEDLTDSSLRTRFGTILIEHLGDSPDSFDQLIERILPGESQSHNKLNGAGAGGGSNQSAAQTFAANVSSGWHQQWQQQQQQQQQPVPVTVSQSMLHTSKVYADANNRTTMRFFRHGRTFASIVYTNPIQDNEVKPRRLINCHLVDLERHSSDVIIYETKYNIKTIDVEFKEFMQLIEACTNIARLKRRPVNGIGQQPGAPGSQYLTSSYHQATTETGFSGVSSHRPTLVVGRPAAALGTASPPPPPPLGQVQAHAQTVSHVQQQQQQQQTNAATQVQQQQQQQQTQMQKQQSNAKLVAAAFQQVISGALNRELQNQKHSMSAASELDSIKPTLVFSEQHNHISGVNTKQNNNNKPAGHHHSRKQQNEQQQQQQQHHHANDQRRRFEPYPTPMSYINYTNSHARQLKRQLSHNPVVKTLAKVGETSKRLVLGEVTAPPSVTMGRNGGGGGGGSNVANGGTGGTGGSSLREALQEISSYDTSDLLSIWRGILPGTNWCGMGDRATSYNDLGFESDIDICCRAHDFCPVRLSAFTSGYGLFNWSFYTRSHCWCDQNFLDCLQQAESPLSTVVMKFYFGIMKTTCLNDVETTTSEANESQEQQQQSHLGGGGGGQQKNNRQHNKQAGGGRLPTFIMSNLPSVPALKQSQWLQTKFDQPKQ